MIRFLEDGRSLVVRNSQRQSTSEFRLSQASQGKACCTASRNGDKNILGRNGMLIDESQSLLGIVLRTFNRPQQSSFTSCNKQHQTLSGPAKCRSEFRPILHSQASGGTGTNIDQSSAILEPRPHCHYCRGNLFTNGLNCRHSSKLAFNDGFGNILGLPQINARISGAGTLSAHSQTAWDERRVLHQSGIKWAQAGIARSVHWCKGAHVGHTF